MNLSLSLIIILFSTPFIIAYGDNMGRLALELEDSPGSGTFTEVWFQQGNQGNQWDQFTVDLSAEDNTGTRQLRFVATETTTGIRSDMAVDEITIQGVTVGSPQTISNISFEDFESRFTTWNNTRGDNNDCWRRDASGTSTGNTGPNTGAIGTKRYEYYESSNDCSPGKGVKAFLAGPTIDFDIFNNIKVTFWRHMWDGVYAKSLPDLDFMTYKGNQYNKLGKYEMAISIFEEILKNDRNNIQTLTNLGHSYFSLEKYNKAIHRYERAIEIGSNDNLVLNRLQIALLEISSYESEFLDGILEINVHDSKGNLVAYLQTSQIKALNHPISEKFIELWPVSKIIHRNNQDFSIHQKKFVEILHNDTILGFHEIPFLDKMDLPLATSWHYQIPVEKGDTVSYLYSIYRPVN